MKTWAWFALAAVAVIVAALFFIDRTGMLSDGPARRSVAELNEEAVFMRAVCTGAGTGLAAIDANDSDHCTVCPEGSHPGTPAAAATPTAPGFNYQGVLPGHFTAAEADEALVIIAGCEGRLTGTGGAFLLRRAGGAWRSVRYVAQASVNVNCKKLRWAGGREAAICEQVDLRKGGGTRAAVTFTTFDDQAPPAGESEGATLLEMDDDTSLCGPPETGQPLPPAMLQFSTIAAIDLLPAGPDGRQDVAIRASFRRMPQPDAAAHQHGDPCSAGRSQSFRIQFHNLGDRLQAGQGSPAPERADCCMLQVSALVRPRRL